jgi:hypothetical protein
MPKMTERLKHLVESLDEASIGRFHQYLPPGKGGKVKSYAIVTSWRSRPKDEDGDLDTEMWVDIAENRRNWRELKRVLQGEGKRSGWGYFVSWGVGQDYDEGKTTYEPVMVISNIPLREAISLGEMFEQNSIVWAGGETGGEATLYYMDGSPSESLGKFHASHVGDFYTVLRGATFSFNVETEGLAPLSYQKGEVSKDFAGINAMRQKHNAMVKKNRTADRE